MAAGGWDSSTEAGSGRRAASLDRGVARAEAIVVELVQENYTWREFDEFFERLNRLRLAMKHAHGERETRRSDAAQSAIWNEVRSWPLSVLFRVQEEGDSASTLELLKQFEGVAEGLYRSLLLIGSCEPGPALATSHVDVGRDDAQFEARAALSALDAQMRDVSEADAVDLLHSDSPPPGSVGSQLPPASSEDGGSPGEVA